MFLSGPTLLTELLIFRKTSLTSQVWRRAHSRAWEDGEEARRASGRGAGAAAFCQQGAAGPDRQHMRLEEIWPLLPKESLADKHRDGLTTIM